MAEAAVVEPLLRPDEPFRGEEGHLGVVGDRANPAVGGSEVAEPGVTEALADLR